MPVDQVSLFSTLSQYWLNEHKAELKILFVAPPATYANKGCVGR